MVDLRRWINRTTPHHLALAGVLAAGLAGCQSAQTVEQIDTTLGPVEATEPVPSPAPPYEDLPVLPEPTTGTATADTQTDSNGSGTVVKSRTVPPPPKPGFDNPDETPVPVKTEVAAGATEKQAAESVGVTKPETVLPDAGTKNTGTAQEQPAESSVSTDSTITPEKVKPTATPVASTPGTGDEVVTESKAPTLPLDTAPNQPAKTLLPETLPDLIGEQPLPTPETVAPKLPKTEPAVTVEPVPESAKPLDTKPVDETAPETSLPLLPETTSIRTKPAGQKSPEAGEKSTAAEPPTPTDKPLPFSGTGEVTVPEPNRSSAPQKAAPLKDKLKANPDTGLRKGEADAARSEVENQTTDDSTLDEDSGAVSTPRKNDEPELEETNAENGRPFLDLPEITPGPRQPVPGETPFLTTDTLRSDRGAGPREVASIRNLDGSRPQFPESTTNDTVRAVEIASFGGTADGIVFDADGTAFVSHRDSISKVTLDGEVTHWTKTGAPRGHAILRDGTHLICDASERAVLHLDRDGKLIRQVVTKSDGSFLRAPDDLAVDSGGGIYFTDPGYARIRNAIGKVHYAAPDGTVSVVATKLAFPEGIAISPDGSKLFVAESQNNRIVEFEILSPGRLGPKEVFCELPRSSDDDTDGFVDGIAVDREGWLYVAHRGMSRVEVIGPDGDWRTSFGCPGTIVKSLAFSRDYSKLFVTGTDQKRGVGGRLLIIDFAASR